MHRPPKFTITVKFLERIWLCILTAFDETEWRYYVRLLKDSRIDVHVRPSPGIMLFERPRPLMIGWLITLYIGIHSIQNNLAC